MMPSKRVKVQEWPKLLDAAILQRFNVETETTFNIFVASFVTSPKDDRPLTDDIHRFIEGFMECVKILATPQ